MSNQPLPWENPDWSAAAREWIVSKLAAGGLQLTGEIDQPYIRPWSTVMRVPTNKGVFFFKATAPYLSHEPALTEYLARFRPELFPELLAVDKQRGWMLMGDAGTPLRQFVRSEKSFARWTDIMPLYVQLQKDLMPYVGDLLALGILDRRLERLPELFEDLVADEDAMLIGQEESLTIEEYEHLKAYALEFKQMCAQLASLGIPETIHHDDFHDANVFLSDGRAVFTDWAESAVTHPFFSLVVLLRGAGNSLEAFSDVPMEAGPNTPEIAWLRDLYLRHWTSYASLKELQAMVGIAERLGYVNRALTWHLVISNLPDKLKPEYAVIVPIYLKEFINWA